jgi:mannonate dehydratase
MSELRITDVRIFLTQPSGNPHCRLLVVKVMTSEAGLFGLGCATFTQRHLAVQTALEKHVGPFVLGKDPRNIEDIWQSSMVNGYWRNGPVLNNAISGVDMALWDIKGKLANMPCYQLFGGKSRPAAAAYVHADGKTPEEVVESARKWMAQGYRHIRCQLGGYPGVDSKWSSKPDGALPGAYFTPREKLVAIPKLFERMRKELGEEIELLHDVHERLAPVDAIYLSKALEPYRLFFLEDVLAPEDGAWLANIRSQCATPMALGELFNHPLEMIPLIVNRQIDFLRVHISQVGGVTPALKLAHLCEAFGIRTAWHGPGDVSPVGVAANIHLDVALHNFGIQEWCSRCDCELEMFVGTPEARGGYVYPNDKPGWGIEFNEKLAAKYPCDDANPQWTVARLPDGTIWRP